MQRSFAIKVREGHPMSCLLLTSDGTKQNFESDLIIIFMVKICLTLFHMGGGGVFRPPPKQTFLHCEEKDTRYDDQTL